MALIKPIRGFHPRIGKDCFLADNATIIGDVVMGDGCSIWFNVVIRGDVHYIRIGQGTNVQDNSVLHVTNAKYPLNIGNGVSLAHGCIIHGCTIGDNTLVGMGAIILDDAVIEENSLVAAGALVLQGKNYPPGQLIGGSPARIIRPLREEEIEKNLAYSRNYMTYKNSYLNNNLFKRIKENDCG